MKIKFNVVQGGVVFTMKNDNATLAEAARLLNDENVISITVTKQTPAQYLKKQRPINERSTE